MQYLKVYRVINFNCLLGIHGKEEHIKQCTSTLKARPYDFENVDPKRIQIGQEVICLSSSMGWARAEVINKLSRNKFQVYLLDYVEDEKGTPICETVSWDAVRSLPVRMSTTGGVPRLGGIFYLIDPSKLIQQPCQHVVDEERLKSLLEKLAESEQVAKCITKCALNPLESVVDIDLIKPMAGFPEGRVEIPFKERVGERNNQSVNGGGRDLLDKRLLNIIERFATLKEEVVYEQRQEVRHLLMEQFETSLLTHLDGNNTLPPMESGGLEDVEGDSDSEQTSTSNSRCTLSSVPFNEGVRYSDASESGSTNTSHTSPYRKEKQFGTPEKNEISRKQKQGQRRKTRAKKLSIPAVKDPPPESPEKTPSDISSGSAKTTDFLKRFLNVDLSSCKDCGMRMNRSHECPGKGRNVNNRRLDSMWRRDDSD